MPIIKGLEWTFNTNAELYEKMRPGYPHELYEDIFSKIELTSKSNAIEIGIGGGQATLPILQTGCKVTAIEYGENLTKVCLEKFKDCQNFSAVVAKFQDVQIPSCSCDLVYCASAFHWVPEEIGYTKVFDILKHGGVFARFANHPYPDKGNIELDNAIQKLYKIYMPHSHRTDEYNEQNAIDRANIAKKYGFVDISFGLYKRTRIFSAQEYPTLLNTYSDHIVLKENIRKEFYTKIENTINDFGGKFTLYDTIDLQLAKKL